MVNVLVDCLQDISDHCCFGNPCVCLRVIFFQVFVHPYFTNALAIDTNILFQNGERFFEDVARKIMEPLQTLRVKMQGVRERNISNSFESEGNVFDVDFS